MNLNNRKGLFPSTTKLVTTTSLSKLLQKRLIQKQTERTKEIEAVTKKAKKAYLNVREELKKRNLKPKYTISDLSREMSQNHDIYISENSLRQIKKGNASITQLSFDELKTYLGPVFPKEKFNIFFSNHDLSIQYEHQLLSDIFDELKLILPDYIPKPYQGHSNYQNSLKLALDSWGTTNADEAIEVLVLNCWEIVVLLNSEAKKIEKNIFRLEKTPSNNSKDLLSLYHQIFKIIKRVFSLILELVDSGTELKDSSFRYQTYNQLATLNRQEVQNRAILNLCFVTEIIRSSYYVSVPLLSTHSELINGDSWIRTFLLIAKKKIEKEFNSNGIEFKPSIF